MVSSLHQETEHAHGVYRGQQQVVGQHAKAAAVPGRPGIHATARDPYGVQYQPGWVGHRDAHGDGAADAEAPGQQLHTES